MIRDMLAVKRVLAPIECLREFVTNYVVIDSAVTEESPLVATSAVILGFNLGGPSRLFDHRLSRIVDVPSTFVSGPQTERWSDLQPNPHLAGLFVRFEPGGFHRLFGVDVTELSDHAYAGTDVIGSEVGALHNVVAAAPSIGARVGLVESFLAARAAVARGEGAVHHAARLLTMSHGACEITRLAKTTGLSERQFRRQFLRQHGMSPKHYAKVVRFAYALRLKDACPRLSWAEVSQQAGYFDQMHLVKDCKVLGAAPPTMLMEIAASGVHPLCDEPFTMGGSLTPISQTTR
jgi:AraC-like DNA-binding protein